MQYKLPTEVLKIIKLFEQNRFEIYIVGGAVRDLIMEKPVYDWDFTTNATPEQMLSFLKKAFYDNQFGTVGIKFENFQRPFEITTFRTERDYKDQRHPSEIKWGKTLEEDLQRRDFTINAMALKVKLKKNKYEITLIDYYGGRDDLESKIIRAVGNPTERFLEDALRMARAVRIATELNFDIEEKTKEAIKNNAVLLKKISSERIRDELLKILSSNYPHEGILKLKETGLLEIIIPELEKCFGVDQVSPNRHHIYDVGTHSVLTLKYTAERNTDPITRFASLIHDIGKYKTYKKTENGIITFYNHEVIGARIAIQIAERLKFSKRQKEKLFKLVRYHQFTVDENQTDSAIRRFVREVGQDNIKDIIDIRVGDRLGSGAKETSWRLEEFKKRLIEVQKKPFTVHDLKIKGDKIMEIFKIRPGPKVGEILDKLFEKVISNQISNTAEDLEKEAKLMAQNQTD